ncbi:hypothetical protein ASE03_08455 [Kitasatospora sp. Root187]|nr:hypothetical protein ASC99_16645 [Kitasatospora sp. Root107]KRB61651.1 hypothetical protein ASE03_08455 [Kitasatospora sp. Root187]
MPIAYRCTRCHSGRRAKNTATELAVRTKNAFPARPTAIWVSPNSRLCTATWPGSGATNCGSSETYRMAIFGLSRQVSSPIRNSRAGRSGASSFGVNTDPAPGRTAFQASQSRYAAPASLRAR